MKVLTAVPAVRSRPWVPACGAAALLPASLAMPRRALTTLLILAVAAPLALPFAYHHSLAVGLLVTAAAFASHLALLSGTLRPNNPLFGPVTTGFTPAHPDEIWLTIDDGPDPHDTPRLLDLLADADAKATFFVRGDRARAHPGLVREILRRGHGLGNHTDTHPQATFWCLGPRRLAREINDCNTTLRTITGTVPRLFRAPVGMINPFVHPAAAACGLAVIGWSARGFDGVSNADPAGVVRRILADLRPGGVALLHEGRRNSVGDAINVQAMQLLLDALRERGWRAVLPPLPTSAFRLIP